MPETSRSTEPPVHPVLPWDEHNRRLAQNVAPPDWVNPRPSGRYNLVVIGAGTAGLVTAAGAAGLGAKVALVERHLMGGDCLNVGCVPSKGLLRSARSFAEVRDAGRFGVRIDGAVRVDFPAVMERMRRLRADISETDSAHRFRDLGVDVFLGEARFAGGDTVEVGAERLRFQKAVIATGARPAVPPIPGLAEAGHLTNETIFTLTELPGRLAVIGAGPIGCEMAQAFRRFGSEVTLIEAEHGVLPREDRDAAGIVERVILADGVRLLCCSKSAQVSAGNGRKRIRLESHDESHELVVDEILVAAGRTPNVETLALESVGVEFDRKGVKVDDRLRTANSRIFAAGDVVPGFQSFRTPCSSAAPRRAR
jgi:pyruvate/2-oxoglutarate dehydrogenase complex dihydrolipoamide dehydrogenase (E3) component